MPSAPPVLQDKRHVRSLGLWLAVCILPAVAAAQIAVDVRAGLIHHLEGPVFLDGKPLDVRSSRLDRLSAGQTLEARGGRAELVLGPNQMLRVGSYSVIELLSADLDNVAVRLREGSLILDWMRPLSGEPVRIESGGASVTILKPGRYRLDLSSDGERRIRVFAGKAIWKEEGREVAVTRKRSFSPDQTLGQMESFSFKEADVFDLWNDRRARKIFRLNKSQVKKKRRGFMY